MQSRNPLALLATLALVSCGGGDIKPKSGTWTYNGSEIVTNSCGDNAPVYASGDFTLTDNGGGSMTVNDGTNTFTCSYDGGSFSCPAYLVETIDDLPIDATLTFNASIEGDLESSTELSGLETVNVTCAGASCTSPLVLTYIDALPCEYTFSFTATAN